jgi:hypothetical protein
MKLYEALEIAARLARRGIIVDVAAREGVKFNHIANVMSRAEIVAAGLTNADLTYYASYGQGPEYRDLAAAEKLMNDATVEAFNSLFADYFPGSTAEQRQAALLNVPGVTAAVKTVLRTT